MGDEPARWHLAEPLTARIAALRSNSREPTSKTFQSISRTKADPMRAIEWREQFPFHDGPLFAQRLSASNISDEEFLCVVADETAALWGANASAWSRTVLDCYCQPESSGRVARRKSTIHNDVWAPFLPLVSPLIEHFAAELRHQAAAVASDHLNAPFGRNVHELLVDELRNSYKRMIAPAMVLELNLASRGGRLSGADAAERFDSFVKGLGDAAFGILTQYPVLARQLIVRGESWVNSNLIFLRDLSTDWLAIRDWLNLDYDIGLLTQIKSQLGDSHCGGRSVLTATFESGLRLVYKPRSLAVDVHFQELLKWINDSASGLSFKTLKVLDRGTHGWVEFVYGASCESPEGVQRFYERQGGYLALLYVLHGSDFHCDNVIAHGEHPVLIDLEALFHAHIPASYPSEWDIAAQAWETSVLRTGLLPMPMRFGMDMASLDRSGLGAINGQMSPLAALRAADAGTDRMHLVREHLPLPLSSHWPSHDGHPVERIESDAIIRGFETVYRIIAAHKSAAHAEAELSGRFRGDEVRVVLRHTRTYARLLTESFHPDVLRNALDRDQLFDLLWADVRDCPHLASIVTIECQDLWNGDVPLFRGRVGSRDVYFGHDQRIANFFPESTDVAARRRLLAMDEADLERQSWLIRASLATLDPGRINPARTTGKQIDPAPGEDVRARLLAHARRIGDRLETLAWRHHGLANWIGLRHDGKDEWSVRPLGPELYDGTAGIVLFLAQLGVMAGEQRYRELAIEGANTLRKQSATIAPAAMGIGAFSGWAGLVYVYSHLAVLWEEPEWLTDARRVAELLTPLIETDVFHDVMGGAAGGIAGLLTLHTVAPSDDLVAAAVRCGDQLLRAARDTPIGIGWPSAVHKLPLAGFSHGVAGITTFLRRLARLSGHGRFDDAAKAALAYERSLFDSLHGNWADLRPQDPDGPTQGPMVAWCHGAVGIGLSRLSMLAESDAEICQTEIAVAVQATLSSGVGDNHCLCHGDLGKLDFLLQAAKAFPHEAWKADIQGLTPVILKHIERNGWRCGINKPVDTLGLMTGLAGIGYGMLRAAAPEIVPPVTSLAPPRLTAPRESNAPRSPRHHAKSD